MKKAKSSSYVVIVLGILSIVSVVILYFLKEESGFMDNFFLLLNGVCLLGVGYINLTKLTEKEEM